MQDENINQTKHSLLAVANSKLTSHILTVSVSVMAYLQLRLQPSRTTNPSTELQLLSLLLKASSSFPFLIPSITKLTFLPRQLKVCKETFSSSCRLYFDVCRAFVTSAHISSVTFITVWIFKDHSAEINVCTSETQANLITSYFAVWRLNICRC